MLQKVGNIINRTIYGHGVKPPAGSIVMLSFLLMTFDAMSSTILLPLLPKMMKKFGSTETDLGHYVGIVMSSMWGISLVFSLLWGYLGDTFGRKRACIATGYGLSVATLLFGFSYNIPYTIVMRSLQGCFMGNVILTKAILANICDDKNMAGAMSIIISSYSIGRIIGPGVGGYLSFPGEKYPDAFPNGNLFARFVVLLPYMIVAILLFISVTLNVIFLPSDDSLNKNEEDMLNPEVSENAFIDDRNNINNIQINVNQENITNNYGSIDSKNKRYRNKTPNFNRIKNKLASSGNSDMEYKRFDEVAGITSQSTNQNRSIKEKLKSFEMFQVLGKRECLICSLLYASFSILDIGFSDTMFPTLVAADAKYGGMSFTPSQIGSVQTAEGVLLIILQMTVLPRVMNYLRPIRTFMVSNLILASLFPIFCVLTDTPKLPYNLRWGLLLGYSVIMSSLLFMGVVSVIILFNNSVDPSLLGIVNGVAATSACVGRMIAPVTAGSIFSWSLSNKGHLGFPFNQYFVFLIFSVLAIVMALSGCFLPEYMNDKVTTRGASERNGDM